MIHKKFIKSQKRFLKNHAHTTKLVVSTRTDKTYKFVLSSLNYKAVLNMMKENFGITDYKIYMTKKDEEKKAYTEYEKFKKIKDKNYISDFDLFTLQVEKIKDIDINK